MSFSGNEATNVICSSSTTCTATLPATGVDETVDLVVSVGGHRSPLGSQDQFTYITPLRIRI